MAIERLLQVFMAALAALGTVLLGMGLRDAALPLAAIVAAMASVWLTDVTGWFHLHRAAAALVGAIVSLAAFREALPLDTVTSVMAIARLLVYLQILLLFLRKDSRVYYQLLVLSLLQVVVATVFNQTPAFGLLLVVYMFVALTTLASLFLYGEMQHQRAPAGQPPSRPSRWPLSGQMPTLSGDSRWGSPPRVHAELFGRVATMGLGTLALTAVAFFMLPRLGQPAWRSVIVNVQRVVGFSGEVELGELGTVIEDPTEIMRVVLADASTGEKLTTEGLYLHGTVLTRYTEGAWRGPHGRVESVPLATTPTAPGAAVTRQTITIEPMESRELFAVRPFFAIGEHSGLEVDPGRQQLLRAKAMCATRLTFTLATTAFRNGRQTIFVPCESPPNLTALREYPAEEIPSVVALANRWADELGPSAARRHTVAKYLEMRLRGSDQFQYSLQPQEGDRNIDPIENFVKNHQQGHCEYFATALALMLRSQGIPARLVVGYHSDEYNEFGGFFQVRQLHAHTWVEAYLMPDELADDLAGSQWQRGAWLRLDPTPGSDEAGGAVQAIFSPLGKGFDWLDFLWRNYVMEMDRTRQRQTIYEPALHRFQEAYAKISDPAWWRRLGQNLLHALNPRNWNLENWFNWRGGLVTIVVCWLGVLLFRGARWLLRRVRQAMRGDGTRGRVHVEFYRRLRVLLARQGLRPHAGQTPREFAEVAGARLARRLGDPALAPLPGEIVDAFYQVRFGRVPLDNPRHEAVEQALSRLVGAQQPRRAARRRTLSPERKQLP